MSDESSITDSSDADETDSTEEPGPVDESGPIDESDPIDHTDPVDGSGATDTPDPTDEASNGDLSNSPPSPDRFDTEVLVAYLRWGALLAFAVLAVVAGGGLYSALGSIIDVWVADRYQPIASAVVNLAVLCVAIAGGLVTLRRS